MEKDNSQIIKEPKQYNVKTKMRHLVIAEKLVENGGNLGKAIKEAGYSETMQKTPKKITESKSFKQMLDRQGLSLDTLNGYLSEDLQKKKQNRFQELQLAYKLHGKLKDTREGDKTLILNVTGESAERFKLKDNN